MFLPIQSPSRLNFQSDFAEDDPDKLSFILNKPDIITQAERAKLETIEAGAQVNLPFGDEANTVTEGNDFRLSDDREWLAPTVTFAEAIAGTNDFRRAWTAARVRAAIDSIAVPKTGGTFSGAVNVEGVLTIDFLYFRSGFENTPVGTDTLAKNTNGSKNVAVGYQSLQENTTGVSNTALGHSALHTNTSGESNTASGVSSLFNNITGNNNTALGSKAGFNNNGSGNVFIGFESGLNEAGSDNLYISNSSTITPLVYGDFSTSELQINGNLTVTNDFEVLGSVEFSTINVDKIENVTAISYDDTSANLSLGSFTLTNITTGTENTALGSFALTSNGDGSKNTAAGRFALNSNISGLSNSAFGVEALRSNTGSFNSAFGVNSLLGNTSGASNCAFGASSLLQNTTGFNNCAFGNQSLAKNTTGFFNSAFGPKSLFENTTGILNSAFGSDCLSSNTTGIHNVAVGANSLSNNKEGNNNAAIGIRSGFSSLGFGNVFIGYEAGFNEVGSNKLYISNSSTTSPLLFGDFAAKDLQVNGDLTVTENLEVVGTVESNNIEISGSATISGLLKSSRLNSLDITLNNTVKNILPPATRGIFAIAFTGTSNNSSNVTHQMESSGLIAYDVGSIKFLSVLTSNSNGLVVVGENDPAGELQSNKIVVGVANGALRLRSTWGENTLTSITFIA